jgi:hypothetical protein
VIHLFVKMVLKVHEAPNFVFVQLIEKEPSIYDKRRAAYAWRNKIGLAWERISHRMEKPDVCIRMYVCIITETYNLNGTDDNNWLLQTM